MIPLFKVNLPENIDQKLRPVFESGYVSQGPKAKKFEEGFQSWLGNPYTAIVNSGTSALTLAMRLAGVGPGTEVITSPMTCLATNEPILSLGGVPVWCDVDPSTGNIDVSKIKELITSRTKAILFVDWAGTPAELDALNEIARQYGLKTIEDAAHSLGAKYTRRTVGTISDLTTFSFQAIKHLTTVDGGALACQIKEDYDRAVLLRWFGCQRAHNSSPTNWEGDVTEHGYKMHMNDVNATIGIEQLKRVDSIVAAHKKNGAYLMEALDGVPGIELLDIPPHIQSSYWVFTLKLRDRAHREEVSKKLIAAGIGNSIVHTRNDEYSLFKDYKRDLPGVDDFGSRMLSVPCGWWVTQEGLDHIVKTLIDAAAC